MPSGLASEARGLRAEGLVLRRAGRAVLDGATLAVDPGEVVVLLGASGTGKSTLLRCLVRLEPLDAGHVRLGDEDTERLPAPVLRRRVAFVTQAPVMLPGTVAENLAYGVPDLPAGRRDRVLAACALEPAFLTRPANQLSGGERARVAIARALTREPEALLLDEPTAALDRRVAGRLAATVRSLAHEQGLGVLVATHDLELAAELGDRALALVDGVVVAGEVAELTTRVPALERDPT